MHVLAASVSVVSCICWVWKLPDGQVDEEIVSRGPGSPGAQAGDDEEQVAEDGDHDGDHVQGDPAPLVVLVEDVPGRDVVTGSVHRERRAKAVNHLERKKKINMTI